MILLGTLLMKLIISDIVKFAIRSIQKKQELHQPKGISNVIIQILHLYNNPPYGKNEEEKVACLIELLIRWIIKDQQAFSVVENADFCEFIAALDQRFQLPTRQLISQSILNLYNDQKEMLHILLSTMPNKFAITTDVWTSCTNLGYLSIMLQATYWNLYC